MKILILIPSITSYYTFLTEVTNKLIIDNNEVNIAASPEHLKNVNCYDETMNGNYYAIYFQRGINPIKHVMATIKLRKLVQMLKPDIIHAHFFSTIFAMPMAKKTDSPMTIATFHGLNSPMFKGWRKNFFNYLRIIVYHVQHRHSF